MQYGFIKVAAAVPTVKVADCQYNLKKIESLIAQAEGQGVEIITFPELCLTGYTCQDLFRQELLLQASETAIFQLLDFTRKLRVISIVGLPLAVGDLLLNCAVVIQAGQVMGVVPKTYLPNYSEFYEKRWFSSAQDLRAAEVRVAGNKIPISSDPLIFCTSDGVKFGIEICEDVWAPTPPSNHLALAGADIIFNLSASNELIGKRHYLMSLLKQQSARTITGYVYASAGFGESTQDLVYGGHAFIYENGSLLAEGQRFAMEDQLITTQIDVERLRGDRRANTTYTNAQRSMIGTNIRLVDMHSACQRDFVLERDVDPQPFIPKDSNMQASCQEIIDIQSMGLVKRLVHTSCKRVIIGISGGLDSTLALLVCVRAFDKLQLPRKGIIGVTMPGFGTTDRTHNNAVDLMNSLGVTSYEISIAKSVMQHFEDIGHDPNIHDITYENSQARERTQILMDLSNKFGGMVIGTGDLSELALGWATYNGDHMSMYGVNASVPKTLIKHLVFTIADELDEASAKTLHDIVDTPISPELIPSNENGEIEQKTEDLVGPYELHDFFLYYFLRHGFRPKKIRILANKAFEGKFTDEVILHWLKIFCRRFFAQQFKRSCLPDGPKVGSCSLSPRGDWRMPSDAANALWLQDLE